MRGIFPSAGPEDTLRIAAELGRTLAPGSVVALHGGLGAGKTCFVKGLAAALGLSPDTVTSPTYTLVHEYGEDRRLVHADLYRIESEAEALRLGLDEAMEAGAITVIEWPARAPALLPARTVHVRLQPGAGPEDRVIEVKGSPC